MLKGIGESFSGEEVKRELEEKLEQLDDNAGKIQVDRHQTLMSAQKGISLPMFVENGGQGDNGPGNFN